MKIARRLASLVIIYIDKYLSRISHEILEGISIYHSTYFQIPAIVKNDERIKKFITIYDLIPVTNPEYFDLETVSLFKALVSSLDPEDYVICISEFTRSTVLKNSLCLPERVLVIPLAASSHFHPSRNSDANAALLRENHIFASDYILSVCTLEIRKNLETVIAAYARLRGSKMIPATTKLVLVGGTGWKTQKIDAAIAAAHEFRDDIIISGYLPEENLAAVYSSARVFIYMSYLEGFGLPPLEAMQCGTPVVASNTSSLPEVVGNAGILLAPEDLEGICHSVSRIYSDAQHHSDLSAMAIERAKNFSWELFLNQTICAYEQSEATSKVRVN